MTDPPEPPLPPEEVLSFYARYAEEHRLESGPFQLERERTLEVLERWLPAPPACVLDVGGGAGTYARWLARRGHEVHLIDASERLVGVARAREAEGDAALASISVGDARGLPQADATVDALLLLGPLYHLVEPEDRARALAEARRVLRPGGALVAAAISRFASALGGLFEGLAADPEFTAMRDRDLADGRHLNESGRLDYFTTAYFHRPQELAHEVEGAGFRDVRVIGLEGPAWLLPRFDQRWSDPTSRAEILHLARALESEPTLLGASAHLLALARA